MKTNTATWLLAAYATYVSAQTSSDCDPTKKSGCPSDPALSSAVFYDFTKGAPSDFTVAAGTGPVFDGDGAKFTISKAGDAPTISSKWYMMFGHYEIVLQTSKGTGIVSSLVLQSDDLDEVDWEWLGADNGNVQTNYYGKGNTAVYDRGQTIPNAANQDSFMTYSLDWTADAIVWAIDGKTIRTLTPQTADTNQYPQSPMQLKIGTWSAGDPGEPSGTVTWAGGSTDYSKAPFTMTIKSVKAVDYSTGKSYSYGDQTGSWGSMKSDGGQINGKGNADASASTVAAAGSSVTQVSGTAANTDVPVSGSTRPATVTTGISGSATGTPGMATATGSAASSNGAKASATGSAASSSATVNSGAGSLSSSAASMGLLAAIVAALAM